MNTTITPPLPPTPIFIVAGEVSGDMLASELMQAINKFFPCIFFGLGGPKMCQQGLQAVAKDNSLLSSVGLLEAIPFILKHVFLLFQIVPNIRKYNIKHVILVDHEVFSIIAAKMIRKAFGHSVKIYFYVAPRVSMWGKKTAPVVASLADAIFCYMKPDVPIYQQYTKNAFYFGNPLAGKLKTFIPDPNFMKRNNLDQNKQYIALMPGSRIQEIKALLPIFLKTAFRLNIEREIEFVMAVAHDALLPKIKKEIHNAKMDHAVHLIQEPDCNLNIMYHIPIGLVSAGTITLEAVMMKMYPIIAYKISEYTFQSIKKSEELSDDTLIGLPNVFLQERIFPEILQFEVTPERLYQEIIYVLDMKKELLEYTMINAYNKLNEALGSPECVDDVARYIIKDING